MNTSPVSLSQYWIAVLMGGRGCMEYVPSGSCLQQEWSTTQSKSIRMGNDDDYDRGGSGWV